MTDKRYPYTYACDFIRGHVDDFNESLGMRTPSISRAQASQCMQAFELVFGLTHEELAKRIADYALSKEQS